MMTDDGHINESDLSQSEVVISEDFPMIEASSEGSFCNRMTKLVEKVREMEFISELDLFKIPLQLNFQGSEIYKTQFGGLVYLGICFACIFLTITLKFSNGVALNSLITQYSLITNSTNTQTVFDNSNTFFQLYLLNINTNQIATLDIYNFVILNIYAFQDINGYGTQLDLQTNCTIGRYCFKQSANNSGATIYGSYTSKNYGAINLEISTCNQMTDVSPTLGLCGFLLVNYTLVLQATTYMQKTGKILTTTQNILLSLGMTQVINVDMTQYTTNQNILGHIANIFSYQINFYQVLPLIYSTSFKTYFSNSTIMNCKKKVCTYVKFVYSGSTNIVTQNFDDVTAPLLFFLSISQTIFYAAYLLFLRNYENNSLSLKIADTLVFIYNPTGAHHNFKSGMATFVACLIHNHPMIGWFNYFLYHFYQTQVKRWMPIKVQMTMDMIEYGQRCLGEKEFFQRINSIYQQQNLQPAKIVVDILDQEEKEEQLENNQEKQTEEDPIFFENQIDSESFRRMCQEHQFYSIERKIHLCFLLKIPNKNNKLVLMAQQIFERYKTQVKRQRQIKEVQLPVIYMQQELSVNHLRKGRQNFD